MELFSNRTLSTSHRSTSQWSTSHWSTSHPSYKHWSSSHKSTRHWSTRHQSAVNQSPVTGQPGTSQPGTCHLDTSQNLPGTSHWSVNMEYQALGTSHQAVYHVSIFTGHPVTSRWTPVIISCFYKQPSHHSRSSERRLPSNDNMGSEHSFTHELPNPATSSRMILLLEPDFSQCNS